MVPERHQAEGEEILSPSGGTRPEEVGGVNKSHQGPHEDSRVLEEEREENDMESK